VKRRRFDHIDLRVRSLEEAPPFLQKISARAWFSRESSGEGWEMFSLAEPEPVEFIWLVEAPSHRPNETRIAMWADSREEVDGMAGMSNKPAA
jgi:hypothetical protein